MSTLPNNMGSGTIAIINDELSFSRDRFPKHKYTLRHLHDVLREEEEELWDEIKKRSTERDKDKIRAEAVQVAAMAIRIIEEAT